MSAMGNTGTTPRSSRGKDKQGKTKVEEGLVVERVAVDDLLPWPGNPRIGDLGLIVESLETNGQYRPLVVQKSTNYVIAGNHTLQAAQHIGWEHVDVTYLDVDDQAAKRIMLVDNRSQDLADYDYDVLAEVLKTVDDLTGTGFIQAELDALLNVQQELANAEDPDLVFPEDESEESNPLAEDQVDEIPDLGTVHTLRTDIFFLPTSDENRWDIPMLLPDMIPELPETVIPWVGPVISADSDDGKQHFMYQYSSDSTRDMPWDRTIMSFYIHDQRFENWWSDPAHYVSRMLNADIYSLVTPDYSLYENTPRSTCLMNVYRAYWIGRFAQEAGVKVIPNLTWRDEDFDYCFAGVPEEPNCAAIQVQTMSRNDKEQERAYVRSLNKVIEQVKPKSLLVYAGPRGRALVESMKLPTRVVMCSNRSEMKDNWRLKRDENLRGEHNQRVK
jgi:hypothetical protein